MKLLIDTNILIPLEPTAPEHLEVNTPMAARLSQLVIKGGHQFYVHSALRYDIDRDRDAARRHTRHLLFQKYPPLPHPPVITPELEEILGSAAKGTNDWVDHCLLAALKANAVSHLVTEDVGIR